MNPVEDYVKSNLSNAKQVQAKYGVPVEVTISQGGIESGWGKQVVGNNLFGIKGSGTKTTDAQTGAKIEQRSYTDATESHDDYGKFLTENPRYKEAFNYKDDPKRFAAEVAKAGYSERPEEYNKALSKAIDEVSGILYKGGGYAPLPISTKDDMLASGYNPETYQQKINADIHRGGNKLYEAYHSLYNTYAKTATPEQQAQDGFNATQTNGQPVVKTVQHTADNFGIWDDFKNSFSNAITDLEFHSKEALLGTEKLVGLESSEELKQDTHKILRDKVYERLRVSENAEKDPFARLPDGSVNWHGVGAGFGGMLGMVAGFTPAMVVGGLVTAATGGAGAAPIFLGLTAGTLAGAGASGIEMAMDGYGSGYEEGLSRGLTNDQAATFGAVRAGVYGAIGAIPGGVLSKKLFGAVGLEITDRAITKALEEGLTEKAFSSSMAEMQDGVKAMLKRRLAQTGKNAVEEAGIIGGVMGTQTMLDHIATVQYAQYANQQDKFRDVLDKTNEDVFKDVAKGAAMGAIMGGIMALPTMLRSAAHPTMYGYIEDAVNQNRPEKVEGLKKYIADYGQKTGKPTEDLIGTVDDMTKVATTYGKLVPSPDARYQVFKLLDQTKQVDGDIEGAKQQIEALKQTGADPAIIAPDIKKWEDVIAANEEKKAVIESAKVKIGNEKKPIDYPTSVTKPLKDINDKLTNILNPEKDAVQKQTTTEGVLREPGVRGEGELQTVEQGNQEQKPSAAGESKKTLNDIVGVPFTVEGFAGRLEVNDNGDLEIVPASGISRPEYALGKAEEIGGKSISELGLHEDDLDPFQLEQKQKAQAEQPSDLDAMFDKKPKAKRVPVKQVAGDVATPVAASEPKADTRVTVDELHGKRVKYKGEEGVLSVDEGGKVSVETADRIYDVPVAESRKAADYEITPVKEAKGYEISNVSETGATVDGTNYTIHTDEKGTITGLSPENKPEQVIKNEKLLAAVESERSKIAYKSIHGLEGEELAKLDEETKAVLPPTEQEADDAIKNIYVAHMTPETAEAIDLLFEDTQAATIRFLTPKQKRLITQWAAKVEIDIRGLQFDEKFSQSELVKSALVELDYITKTAKENVKNENERGTGGRNNPETPNNEPPQNETRTGQAEGNKQNVSDIGENGTGESGGEQTTGTQDGTDKTGSDAAGGEQVTEAALDTKHLEKVNIEDVNTNEENWQEKLVDKSLNEVGVKFKKKTAGTGTVYYTFEKADGSEYVVRLGDHDKRNLIGREVDGNIVYNKTTTPFDLSESLRDNLPDGELLKNEEATPKAKEVSTDYKVTTEDIEMPDGEPGKRVTIEKPNGEKVELGNMYPEDVEKETAKKIRGFKLSETPKEEKVVEKADEPVKEEQKPAKEKVSAKEQERINDAAKYSYAEFKIRRGEPKTTVEEYRDLRSKFQREGGKPIEKATANLIDKTLKKAFPGIKTNFLTGEEFEAKHGDAGIGVVNPDGTVDINTSKVTGQTQIHEMGHIWTSWAKKFAPELYERGMKLAEQETAIHEQLAKEGYDLEGKDLHEETLSRMIGVEGEKLVGDLKEPVTLSEKATAWVKDMWNKLSTYLGKRLGFKDNRFAGLETMTFNEFTAKVAKELISGKEISKLTSEEVAAIEKDGFHRFMKNNRIRRDTTETITAKGTVLTDTVTLSGDSPFTATGKFIRDVGKVIGFTKDDAGKINYDTKDITDAHVLELQKRFGTRISDAIDQLDINKDGTANNMVAGRGLIDAREYLLKNPGKAQQIIREIANEVVNPKNGEKFNSGNLSQDARKMLFTLGKALTQAESMEYKKDKLFVEPNVVLSDTPKVAAEAKAEPEQWNKKKKEFAAKSIAHKTLVNGLDSFNNLTSGIRDWAVSISGKATGMWAETARSLQRAAADEVRMQTDLGNILKPFIKNDKYKKGSIAVSGGVLNMRMIFSQPLDKVTGGMAQDIFKDNMMPSDYKITDMEQINIIAQIDGRPDLKVMAWEGKKIEGETEGTPENVIEQEQEKTIPIHIQESGNREGKTIHLSKANFDALKEKWKDDLPKWKTMWKALFNAEYELVNPIHKSQTGLNLARIQSPERVTFRVEGETMKGELKNDDKFGTVVRGEDGKTYVIDKEDILTRETDDSIYYHPTARGIGKDAAKSFDNIGRHIDDMSSFKERAPSTEKPILIMDEFQMLQSRINNSSKYASWALPIHNGEVMTNVYGKDVLSKRQKEHWNEFRSGLTNPQEKNIGKLEKTFYKGFVQYALGVNPFTALKHISTLVLANNVVPQKYIIQSLAEFPKAGKDLVKNFDIFSSDEKTWNPVMQRMLKSNYGLLRATGNAAEIQSLMDGNGKVRIKTAHGDVEFMGKDTLTMMKSVETATDAVIWRAVEKYVAADFPHLKEGTDAHFDKVEQLFMDGINDSQPSFDYANRSLLSTRSGTINRAFTLFSGQLTAQWNAFARRSIVSMNDPSPKNHFLTAKAFANVFIANAAIVAAIDVTRQQALGNKPSDAGDDYKKDFIREMVAGIPFIGRIFQEILDKEEKGYWANDINAPILEPLHDLTKAGAAALKEDPVKALKAMKDFGEKAVGFPGIVDRAITKAVK